MSARSHDSFPLHGGQLRQIAARYGIAKERLFDFSANINPTGPPQSVRSVIERALEVPSTLATYPDLESVELKEAIAKYTNTRPENIAVANGFVPLLEAALRSLRIQKCLLPVPCFGEYRRTLENVSVDVVPYRLAQDQGFGYQADTIRQMLLDCSCDAILLANPQNPSGALCNTEEMLRLIQIAVQHNVAVLIDEAFIDYCPLDSLTKHLAEQSRVIVFRSVTKFFAIPGLRVAYAISNPLFVEKMNRFIAPWPISSLASHAVCAALQEETYAERSRIANEQQRLWLERELLQLGIATYPSRANFLLLRFPDTVDVDRLWERMIVEEQVVLRSCRNFEGLVPGHLRVAVRAESENERLISCLERVLSSQDSSTVTEA
jgi:threonine-phosphate decarboxylase